MDDHGECNCTKCQMARAMECHFGVTREQATDMAAVGTTIVNEHSKKLIEAMDGAMQYMSHRLKDRQIERGVMCASLVQALATIIYAGVLDETWDLDSENDDLIAQKDLLNLLGSLIPSAFQQAKVGLHMDKKEAEARTQVEKALRGALGGHEPTRH